MKITQPGSLEEMPAVCSMDVASSRDENDGDQIFIFFSSIRPGTQPPFCQSTKTFPIHAGHRHGQPRWTSGKAQTFVAP